jgi:Ner family transcriptional regulator
MTKPQDWHAEDIKAAIRKTGVTLTSFALAHGLCESAVRQTLRRPWPRVEALIAGHLKLRPQAIWPSRYDARGRPLAGQYAADRADLTAGSQIPQRQKDIAA